MNDTPQTRANELLKQLTLDEKIYQVTADMIFEIDDAYDRRRNPLFGHYRNPGHLCTISGKRPPPRRR